MKLTIDISDDLYKGIVKNEYGLYNGKFFDMIRNGTPLLDGEYVKLIDAYDKSEYYIREVKIHQ